MTLHFSVVGIICNLLNFNTNVDYTSHDYREHSTSFNEKKIGKEMTKEKGG